jgi:hypothetical protein
MDRRVVTETIQYCDRPRGKVNTLNEIVAAAHVRVLLRARRSASAQHRLHQKQMHRQAYGSYGYGRYGTGFWPADVAASIVGGAIEALQRDRLSFCTQPAALASRPRRLVETASLSSKY